MGTHSIFGPSKSSQWLLCPGSVEAQKNIPETTSKEAQEGTDAHELADICLRTNKKPHTFIDTQPLTNAKRTIDIEMADNVNEYVNYVRGLGGVQEYEQIVYYDRYVPGGFGTCDATVDADDTLYVIDFKYGQGVMVYALENTQMMLYGLGALILREAFQKFKKIVLVIFQPRRNHIDTWETTPEHIYEFGEYAKKQALLCLKNDAPRIPGDKQCLWCLAKPACPALRKHTELTILNQFDDLTTVKLKTAEQLNEQQLGLVLKHKPLIIKWLNSVEKHVREQLESGEDFAGWKLVAGRNSQRWTDENAVERVLKRILGARNAYNKKLLSVAQAKKTLGKERKHRIEKFIIKETGAPALVPENDKRPALKQVITEDFDKFDKPQTTKQEN
jgi:hypothetical protein